jgi:GTPase SAR1 family protein
MNIALVGPRKSGKSTAAEALINAGYTRLSLADPVKDAAVSMVNRFWFDEMDSDNRESFSRDDIDTDKAVFRPLLEWIGSTFGRDYLGTPDRWITMFRERAHRTPGPIVCDDVRFPNEAGALREMGFLIVRILRPTEARMLALDEAGETRDWQPSEEAIEEIVPDYTLHNHGTVDDLQRLVLLLARKEAA